MPGIHESGENYLETILVLRERGVDVRSIDIVHEMELSKPSVSRAMSILRSGGFIEVDRDGYITLTEPGEAIAQRIYERHRVLTDWLIGINFTSVATLKYGNGKLLNIGRVILPTVKLVYDRDMEIRNFVLYGRR